MQSFFFDRRSRKRNRRLENPAAGKEQAVADQTADERRQEGDRRQEGRSTLDHYYAVHDMEVDDFADLDAASTVIAQKRPLPGKPNA